MAACTSSSTRRARSPSSPGRSASTWARPTRSPCRWPRRWPGSWPATGSPTGALAQDLATVEATLPALLDCPDAAALDLGRLWRPRPQRDRLRAPIGVAADGSVLELDVKEAAQDGMGPHGLLIGATGSGKSELLRTLVLGLAATHPPDVLNMVLVDFKGGATFAGMSALRQVAAVITNLQDDEGLVARMHRGALRRAEPASGAPAGRGQPRLRPRLRAGPPARRPARPAAQPAPGRRRVLRADRPAGGVRRPVRADRAPGPVAGPAPAAGQPAAGGGQDLGGWRRTCPTGSRCAPSPPRRAAPSSAWTRPTRCPAPRATGCLRTDTTVLTRFRTAYVSGPYGDAAEAPDGLLAGPSEVRPFPASIAARAAAPGGSRRGTGGRGRPHPADRAERDGRPDRRGRRPRAPGVAAPARRARAPRRAARRHRRAPRPGPGRRRARAVRPDRDRRPALPAAPGAVRRRPLRGRWPRRCRRAATVGQVDRAADARGRARAAAHPRRGAVLLPRLLRRAARAAGPAARRRGGRAPGARGRAAAGRRGRHDPGGPGAALPRARRRLDGHLPADARRGGAVPSATTRSATSSSSSTAGGCCAGSSRSSRRRSSRWPPAR